MDGKLRVQEYAVLDQFLHVSNLKFQAFNKNLPHPNIIGHTKL